MQKKMLALRLSWLVFLLGFIVFPPSIQATDYDDADQLYGWDTSTGQFWQTWADHKTQLSLLYQGLDSDLTIYAGITPSANVQTMLGSADYAAILSNIGAEPADANIIKSGEIDSLTELNAIVLDATLLDDGAIADSVDIGLDDGSTYTTFGAASDDSLNEMFAAIDTGIGGITGDYFPSDTLADLQARSPGAGLVHLLGRESDGDGGEGIFRWDATDLSSTLVLSSVTTTAVNDTTETCTKTAHGLVTGDGGISTTAVNGLSTNTVYWVIRVDADNFKLATSWSNAVAGTAIDLTGTTNFSYKELLDPICGLYAPPNTDLTGTSGSWVRERNTAIFNANHFTFVTSNTGAQNQAAWDYLIRVVANAGGGHIYIPAGSYAISTFDQDYACMPVDCDNVVISGDGSATVLYTSTNSHIGIHVSSERDVTQSAATVVHDVEIHDLTVRGTGVYEYFDLKYGRGILLRRADNVCIHHCYIEDFSMIGICTESGKGYFRASDNNIHNCKYTAINYNGQCYQSIISNNICSGSNASVNSASIQACGHCIITNNTCLGDLDYPSTSGGIIWGEGNYTGVGIIQGNIVKHCRFGIQAIYHGPVIIDSNYIINCVTVAGIVLSGGTGTGMTVANSDNIVSNNTIINCYTYGISCSADNTTITGNKILSNFTIVNPSSSGSPDYQYAVQAQTGIRFSSDNVSIIGNSISGCVRAITPRIYSTMGVINNNHLFNNTYNFGYESSVSSVFAYIPAPIPERINYGGANYINRVYDTARPTKGNCPVSSVWTRTPAISGSSIGEIVTLSKSTEVAVEAGATETVITIDSASGWVSSSTKTVVGIELDNGSWHWTTVSNVSGNDITLSAGIPASRTAEVDAQVLYNYWEPLANL